MSELGAYIKNRRNELGLSIDDLYEMTKIRPLYLTAIENGDFHVLPGQVYLKGFLRAIARELDIDYQCLLELQEIKADTDTPISTDAEEDANKSINKNNNLGLWTVIILVGASLIFYIIYHLSQAL